MKPALVPGPLRLHTQAHRMRSRLRRRHACHPTRRPIMDHWPLPQHHGHHRRRRIPILGRVPLRIIARLRMLDLLPPRLAERVSLREKRRHRASLRPVRTVSEVTVVPTPAHRRGPQVAEAVANMEVGGLVLRPTTLLAAAPAATLHTIPRHARSSSTVHQSNRRVIVLQLIAKQAHPPRLTYRAKAKLR